MVWTKPACCCAVRFLPPLHRTNVSVSAVLRRKSSNGLASKFDLFVGRTYPFLLYSGENHLTVWPPSLISSSVGTVQWQITSHSAISPSAFGCFRRTSVVDKVLRHCTPPPTSLSSGSRYVDPPPSCPCYPTYGAIFIVPCRCQGSVN